MVRRLLLICMGSILLTGCYMVPMALIGPASSGFSSASILQSGLTTGVDYLVKKSTGKTIGQHALATLNKSTLRQTYFPEYKK